MAPNNRTEPNIRKKRKVSGSAYGRPSFAPINPDAHKTTNKPGAATIVKCSIGVTADSELSDVMRMDCAWKVQKKIDCNNRPGPKHTQSVSVLLSSGAISYAMVGISNAKRPTPTIA
jgi:hypothetical protein